MKADSQRYHEVARSQYDHEKLGIAALLSVIPDAAPYRVWSDFEFIDDNGQWHEVDALVVGQRRVHLVELKNWSGTLTGDEHRWRTLGGAFPPVRNPGKLARYKAQRLASRLQTVFNDIFHKADFPLPPELRKVPWVQEAVFLTHPEVVSDLTDFGAKNVFGLDGYSNHTQLHGISERLTEAPDAHGHITENLSKIMLESALEIITGKRQKRREHTAGSWILKGKEEWDDQVEVWSAQHRVSGHKGLVHVPVTSGGQIGGAQLRRQVNRAFTLLSGIKHEGIDAPVSQEYLDETDLPVLVYPAHGTHESLDFLFPGATLTAQQQIDLILQIADAVAYAHDHNVVHRGLGPGAVTVDVSALKDPTVSSAVKVRNWSLVGEVTAASTTQLHSVSSTSDGFGDVFLPPEGFDASDRRTAELFSVGALAYFILSQGNLPATDIPSLMERLSDGGLDLAATGSPVEEKVRELIRDVTSAAPADRRKAVANGDRRKATEKINPVRLFADRLRALTSKRRSDDGTDALHPTIGGRIANRFTVEKVSGRGSTAVGLRVQDDDHDGATRILKVALNGQKAQSLRAEAEVLENLQLKLGGHPTASRFVKLLEPVLDLPHSRTALLLSDCGEYSLNDLLNMGGTTPEVFWRLGEQLLEILVALESTGIAHRDIKPPNLGVTVSGGYQHLALFDFSLSAVDLKNTEAGTPPFRDPFFSSSWDTRTQFDSFAERYSATVVLYQLATNDTPVYGDGETAAALTDGRLKVESSHLEERFSPAQADALSSFFEHALDGRTTNRPKDAEELRQLFLAAKRAQSKIPEQPAAKATRKPQPDTAQAPAKGTAISSFRDFSAELISLSGAQRTSVRRYVEHVLGEDLTDPFATARAFADLLNVSNQRMSQVPHELGPKWRAQKEVADVLNRLSSATRDTLRDLGGIATPRQLASVVAEVLPDDADAQTLRQQIGILRIIEVDSQGLAEPLAVIRRGKQQTAIALALTNQEIYTSLPSALQDCARHLTATADVAIVPRETMLSALNHTALEHFRNHDSNLQLGSRVLPQLATAESHYVALTAAGELYSRDLPLATMLTDIIKPSTSAVNRSILQNHLEARFPAARAQKLPASAELLALLQQIDPSFVYNSATGAFTRGGEIADHTYLGTRQPTPTSLRTQVPADSESREFLELVDTLSEQLPLKSFRAISIQKDQVGVIAKKLGHHFSTTPINLSDRVLAEIQNLLASTGQADRLDALFRLDTESTRQHITRVVRTAAEKVVPQFDHHTEQVVILTDISILANYDALDLLKPWAEITGPPNPRAMWVLVPHDGPAPSASLSIDGVPLPLTSPAQIINLKELHA